MKRPSIVGTDASVVEASVGLRQDVFANFVAAAPADHVVVAPQVRRRFAEVAAVQVAGLGVVGGQFVLLGRENRNVVQVGAEDVPAEVAVFLRVKDEVVPESVDFLADDDAVARILLEDSQGQEPLHLRRDFVERGLASREIDRHAVLRPGQIEIFDQLKLRQKSRRNTDGGGAGKSNATH